MFLEQQISILEWFLKDHVTLTEVMAAEISALHHRNKLHVKIDLHLFNNYFKFNSISQYYGKIFLYFWSTKRSLGEHKILPIPYSSVLGMFTLTV